MVRLAAGVTVPDHPHPLGEEALLVDGDLEDDQGSYGPGCWVRNPPGSHHWASTKNGCLLYVRTGGLGLAVG
jgi:anti-sigma factor ChrR (cupin superfamily)